MVEIFEKRRETKVKKEKYLRQELKEFAELPEEIGCNITTYANISKMETDMENQGKSSKSSLYSE